MYGALCPVKGVTEPWKEVAPKADCTVAGSCLRVSAPIQCHASYISLSLALSLSPSPPPSHTHTHNTHTPLPQPNPLHLP